MAGLRTDWHSHRRVGRVALRSTIGAEARWDGIHVDRFDATSQDGAFRERLGRHVDDSPLAFNGNDDDIDIINVAAFAEEDVRLGRRVRIVGALRVDYFGWTVSDGSEDFRAPTPSGSGTSGSAQRVLASPKLSAVFTPWDGERGRLSLFLNFGMGFHTNQARAALVDDRVIGGGGGADAIRVRAVPRIYGGEVGARLRLLDRIELAAALWSSYLESETLFDAAAAAFVPATAGASSKAASACKIY